MSTPEAGWLLLTAAVHPDPVFLDHNGSFPTTVADPVVRAGQYREALAFWQDAAHRLGARVVVVDTSGATRSEFGLTNRRDVVLVDHRPDPSLAVHGKGAFEASAIDAAIAELELPDLSPLCKITGRLRVLHADRVISRPIGTGIVRVRRTIDRSFCDTRFLQTTAGTWRSVLGDMAHACDDGSGHWLERVVAERLVTAEYADRVGVERFPARIVVMGQSGTTGHTYGSRLEASLPEVVMRKVEGLAKRTFGHLTV